MALDPTTLRTLTAVVRTGSFSAAGRQLGYTPSAVSQQMAALERSLGLQLFERQARRVSPTESAQYVLEQAKHVLELIDHLEVDIQRLAAGQAGRLRIGSFDSAGSPIVANVIARFLTRRHDVEIFLDEGEPSELFPRVLEGDLDIALGFRYDLVPTSWPEQVRLTEVLVEDLHVIAHPRHRLASKDSVDFSDLRTERWISNREDTAASACLFALGAAQGFVPNVAFRSNSFGTVRGFVSAGLGVALIPNLAYRTNEDIVALPISQPLPRRQVVAATRHVDSNPLTSAFLTALRNYTSQLNRHIT